jgi:hypothetical protein
MSLPAQDTFNRAAGDVGANWTPQTGGFQVNAASECEGTAAGAYNQSFWNADAFANNQYSQGVYLGGGFFGVAVRASGTAGSRNGYYCLLNQAGNSRVSKVVAGTITDLIAPGSLPDPATNDLVKITAVGTTIAVYYNGILQGTTTDSSLTTGSAGLMFYDNNARLDTWEGGNITSVSAAITGTAAAGITEADVVAGGRTIIITLSGTNWIT